MPATKPYLKRKPKGSLDKFIAKIILKKLLTKAKDMKIPQKLQSRKLWVTVLGATLVSFGAQLGFEPETVNQLVAVLVAYLLGNGIAAVGTKVVKPEVIE